MTRGTTTDIAYAIEHGLTAILGLMVIVLLATGTYHFGLQLFENRSGKRLLWLTGLVVVGLIVGL